MITQLLKAHLKGHIDSIDTKLKPYKCPLSNYTASEIRTLKIHIDIIHTKLKPHKCPICDNTFFSKRNS